MNNKELDEQINFDFKTEYEKDHTPFSLKKGSIAVCGAGGVGLITCDHPILIKHKGELFPQSTWIGIHILEQDIMIQGKETHVTIGDPWSSRKPTVVAHIMDFMGDEEFLSKILCLR